ncbi:LysR substrate-binding domain-containing protein [Knoellia sp. CPCC 206435]|uniref:LysR substrate-binding domain-containing protein n=1 Tax=Knoellia terrae TaxID=3404797 RepID=UPI003B4396B5
MELRHLRYFVAVAEELHFGRAAARLHMAQPPLSQQIKQLEAEIGVQLLTRSTRRVELTPAGKRYLARARAVLADVDDAGDEAQRVAAGEVGRVALGLIGSATYDLLPTIVPALRERCPDIVLDLRGELLTPAQEEGLRDGSLDICILRPPVRDPGLRVRVLRREPLVAVLPATHQLADRDSIRLADLRDEPFITYPSRHRSVLHDATFDACQRAGFVPQVVQEVSETSTLVVFVAAGLGVALVPEPVRHLTITGAVYRPLEGAPSSVELAVATRGDERSPHVLRILGALRSLLAPEAAPSAS